MAPTPPRPLSLGRSHLDCVKWNGDSIEVNDAIGRVYFSSFTLKGRKWTVGDFCRCGDEIFRIVGAFQATESFVGLWRKKRQMEEIQKMGHPYVLVVPLLWLRPNRELVLPITGKWRDGGHIDVLPQWLGEDTVAKMEKLSVGVGEGRGADNLQCSNALVHRSKWNRQLKVSSLTDMQRSLLTGGAQELLDRHVAKAWNPVFKAQRVRFVHSERPHHTDHSLPLYYTEDSSDDDSEGPVVEASPNQGRGDSIEMEQKKGGRNPQSTSRKNPGASRDVNANSSFTAEAPDTGTSALANASPMKPSPVRKRRTATKARRTLATTPRDDLLPATSANVATKEARHTPGEDEMSPNKKQAPRRRTRVSLAEAFENADKIAASAAKHKSKEETPQQFLHSDGVEASEEPGGLLHNTAIGRGKKSLRHSSGKEHLENGSPSENSRANREDESMSPVELVRRNDDDNSCMSPQLSPTPTNGGKLVSEESFVPGDQKVGVSDVIASPSPLRCPPLAALSSRSEGESLQLSGSQSEARFSPDMESDSHFFSDQETNTRFSIPLSNATSDFTTGDHDIDGSVGTMDYTMLQRRRAQVFGSGEIGRLQRAAKKCKGRRLNFFNSDDGRTLRLVVSNHGLRQRPGEKQWCVLCGDLHPETNRRTGHRTSYRCTTCGDVPLCTRTYPGQTTSCWTEFHAKPTLRKRSSFRTVSSEEVQHSPSDSETSGQERARNELPANTANAPGGRPQKRSLSRRRDGLRGQTQPILCGKRRRKSA